MNPLMKKRPIEIAIAVRTKLYQNTAVSFGIVSIIIATLLGIVFVPAPVASPNPDELAQAQTALLQSVRLSWTAPGGDGPVGRATAYSIRWSATALSESNWATATVLSNPPVPGPAGTEESVTVSDLLPKQRYSFGVKSVDSAGNWSGLSNVVSKLTGCTEEWSCGSWTTCADGFQTRTCTDAQACGTVRDKPATRQECAVGGPSQPAGQYLVAVKNGRAVTATRLFDSNGNLLGTFNAYGKTLQASLNVITADVDKDGAKETVTFLGKGYTSTVRVFTSAGQMLGQFTPFARTFRGGIRVEAADVNKDGRADLVVRPIGGRSPVLRVYTYSASLKRFVSLGSVNAGPTSFRGPLALAIADVTGDGADELISAPAESGVADVNIFAYNRGAKVLKLLKRFRPYPDTFRGGVSLAAANVANSAAAEIVVAPAKDGGPNVRVYRYNTVRRAVQIVNWFMAYQTGYRGGVELTLGDLNTDGLADIVTVPRTGGPNVRVYTYRDALKKFKLLDWFFPYSTSFSGGVTVGIANLDADAANEMIITPKRSGGSDVSVYEYDASAHQMLHASSVYAYGRSYRGTIQAKLADLDDDGRSEIIVTPLSDHDPAVRVYTFSSRKLALDHWFYAFSKTWRNGVKTAAGALPPS